MIGQGYVFKKVGDKLFDQDTAKIVKRHAFWASMVMMTPFEVFDSICYVIILWHMYSKLCERANTSLNFGNIIAGVIINVIIAAVISALCIVFFPITGIVVYLQFYLSGKGYISTLKNVMGYNYPDTPNTQTPAQSVQPTYNQPALQPQQFNAPIQDSPSAAQSGCSANNRNNRIASIAKAIIVDKLGVDESEVTPDASFTDDLGADDLETVELIMQFEKEFGITIPDDQAERIQTVGQAIAYIEQNKLFNVVPSQNALPPQQYTAVQPSYNPPAQIQAQRSNNLLTCPECGQMVSRRADACPNCGCPISEMNQ